jgi:hypothetical protein
MSKKEKVYLTRDEGDDTIYVWKKPSKGNWAPQQLKGCDQVNFQREDMDNVDVYLASDFKKKFGTTIRPKTKKCVHLPYNLLNNEDYKLFSDDPNRKQ